MRMTGLGIDLNLTDVVKSYVNDVLNYYQAKVGTFLTYPQKLDSMKTRLADLSAYPDLYNSAASLLLEVNSAISNQNYVMAQATSIIEVVTALKSDPIIIDAMAGRYPNIIEIDKYQRINDFVNKAGIAKNSLSGIGDAIDRQTNIVNSLESRISALESGKGISGGTSFLKNIPVGVWIGIGFIGIKLVGGKLIKAFKK